MPIFMRERFINKALTISILKWFELKAKKIHAIEE